MATAKKSITKLASEIDLFDRTNGTSSKILRPVEEFLSLPLLTILRWCHIFISWVREKTLAWGNRPLAVWWLCQRSDIRPSTLREAGRAASWLGSRDGFDYPPWKSRSESNSQWNVYCTRSGRNENMPCFSLGGCRVILCFRAVVREQQTRRWQTRPPGAARPSQRDTPCFLQLDTRSHSCFCRFCWESLRSFITLRFDFLWCSSWHCHFTELAWHATTISILSVFLENTTRVSALDSTVVKTQTCINNCKWRWTLTISFFISISPVLSG